MSEVTPYTKIVVALDGSEAAEAAVPVAAALARGAGAVLRLLHVAPQPEAVTSDGRVVAYVDQEIERLRCEGEDYLGEVAARLPGVRSESVVRFGDPAEEIVAEVKASGADLVVVATRGRTGLPRLLMGSVAESILRRAPCQVLVVKREETPHEPAKQPAPSSVAHGERCLVCSGPSQTAICPRCEARIRGEALERKLEAEAAGRKGGPV